MQCQTNVLCSSQTSWWRSENKFYMCLLTLNISSSPGNTIRWQVLRHSMHLFKDSQTLLKKSFILSLIQNRAGLCKCGLSLVKTRQSCVTDYPINPLCLHSSLPTAATDGQELFLSLLCAVQPAVEGENGMIRLLTSEPWGRRSTIRTAGVSALADTAKIIKSCLFSPLFIYVWGETLGGGWELARALEVKELISQSVIH